jgi:hypothetical protein
MNRRTMMISTASAADVGSGHALGGTFPAFKPTYLQSIRPEVGMSALTDCRRNKAGRFRPKATSADCGRMLGARIILGRTKSDNA